MKCPKCNSKILITQGITTPHNEHYRKCKCTNDNCKHVFYTIEFVAANTEEFMEEWYMAFKTRADKYKINRLKGETK